MPSKIHLRGSEGEICHSEKGTPREERAEKMGGVVSLMHYLREGDKYVRVERGDLTGDGWVSSQKGVTGWLFPPSSLMTS